MVGPIGVDLDNTIVSYDNVLFRVALEQKLIGPTDPSGKKAVRDAVRKLPDGEIKWQKLQSQIYGPRMKEAELIDSVKDFFYQCRLKSIPVYIVSHKTEFANYDTSGTNLRLIAMDWLHENRFFEPEGIGLDRQKIFFESTRQEKIERIKALGCKLFIDDLEETFLEKSFPDEIQKIILDRHGLCAKHPGVKICSSWSEIIEIIFE
ncbi:hypothetical protein ACFL7E_06040 [Thermodesulfobacteriota bacterium]